MAAKRRGPSAEAPGKRPRTQARAVPVTTVNAQDLDALRQQLESTAKATGPGRWNADPGDVQRSVIKLVLTLVEFLRQLMERQAIRRMENQTLSPAELEQVGQALMKLEETIASLARQFDLDPSELNLDLGPLGKLL